MEDPVDKVITVKEGLVELKKVLVELARLTVDGIETLARSLPGLISFLEDALYVIFVLVVLSLL